MRILHVAQPTDGGVPALLQALVRSGVDAGHTVVVACPDADGAPAWIAAVGAEWQEVPMTRAPAISDAAAVLRLRRLAGEADIVHLHSSKAGAVGRLAAASLGRRRPPVVFTPHGWSWLVGGRAAGLYRWFERQAVRATDVITVVSRGELAQGLDTLPAGAHLVLIENGVDTERFHPGVPPAPRPATPLVVQVGRLARQKGQDRSIRALAGLSDQRTRLRLVGDGPDAASLRALACRLGVEDRVEFVGTTDPLPHVTAADVVVLPSRWEGMSLVLLEAMSAGAAVVASDCGGSDALAGCGLLIDHRDDDRATGELVEHVDRLLSLPHERERLGALARARVLERHRLHEVTDRYRALWSDLRAPRSAV